MRRLFLILGGTTIVVAVALGISAASQREWERAGRERWPPRGTFVSREHGRALRVWCEGAGPVVVLEATGLGNAEQYDRIIDLLKDRARLCAYDRAGYGYSDERRSPTSLEDLRDDLWAVAERGGRGPYVWVAGSFGGLPVLYTARSHVASTRGIVLLDAIVPAVLRPLESARRRLARTATGATLLASWGLLRKLDPLELGDTQEAWLTYRAGVWRGLQGIVSAADGAFEALERLPPLPPGLPLKVVRHEKVGDMMSPLVSLAEHHAIEPLWQSAQAQMAASSTRGALVVASGAGHYIASDRPELVARLIQDVLEAHEPANQ